ncbi:MAG: selenide, water dikinase SelD [Planctomycetes bacterium]|nr:selenide, water dikinase SelD [Planctomycetota bacterium]
MSPAILAELLKMIPKKSSDRLLVGTETFDDAGVFKLNDETALVFTTDFFAPVVDDAKWYGRISASNSLSDVYAMGAQPLIVLNAMGYPSSALPPRIIADILIGAGEKIEESGAILAGGHTMEQSDIFFGLAVVGTIHPDKILTNAGAKVGDILILSKPIGSGILSTSLKNGILEDKEYQPLLEVMARLNKYAMEASLDFNINSMTDVTGYGFMGHLREMMAGSQTTAVVQSDLIPLVGDVIKYAKLKQVPGGSLRNKEYLDDFVRIDENINRYLIDVLFDAQTSGGLLISLPEDKAQDAVSAIRKNGEIHAEIVGKVIAKENVDIILQ